MARYGYQDMPNGYTDIGMHRVTATCADCGAGLSAGREACWLEGGQMMTYCGCTELLDPPMLLPGTHPDASAPATHLHNGRPCRIINRHVGSGMVIAYVDDFPTHTRAPWDEVTPLPDAS